MEVTDLGNAVVAKTLFIIYINNGNILKFVIQNYLLWHIFCNVEIKGIHFGGKSVTVIILSHTGTMLIIVYISVPLCAKVWIHTYIGHNLVQIGQKHWLVEFFVTTFIVLCGKYIFLRKNV